MDKGSEDIKLNLRVESTGDGGIVVTDTVTMHQFLKELFEHGGNDVVNWLRKSSLWYLLFGLACCAIEMMQTGGPRTDLDRFGMVFRATPRQADLLIVSGTLTYKMAERALLLYEQMTEPKYCLAMGSCATSGGLFQRSYSVVKGVDLILPVDVYVPGCPPRPEALLWGMMKIQELMMKEDWLKRIDEPREAKIKDARFVDKA